MPDLTQDTLVDDRYKVIKRIGSGGMADVYLCQDINLRRKIALKILHNRFAQDQEFVERFRREAQAAAGLQHPSVVAIYDRGDYDGTYYIAMEYLEGKTLKEVISSDAPLPHERAIEIARQILSALKYAHRNHIIHRDIKPQNVMVDEEDRVKVTDFGIARAGGSQITEAGSIMGTAQYLSPEQAQGQSVDEASDIYSVGIVLYEMLTAKVPFTGESAVAIALKHVNEKPAPVSKVTEQVPQELEQIVERALAKDARARFQSAEDFSQALKQLDASVGAKGEGGKTQAWAAVEEEAEGKEKRPKDKGEQDKGEKKKKGEGGKPSIFKRLFKSKKRIAKVAAILLLAIAAAASAYFLTKPEQVAVPSVTGKQVEDARSQLERLGFVVEVKRVKSNAALGIVLEQDPISGKKADEESTVLLTVSEGPGFARVPKLDGLTEAGAKSALKKAGFKADIERQYSSDVAQGYVISSDPSEGDTLSIGSVVTLTVSKGPKKVPVPSVVGLLRDDAVGTLEQAGLNVVVDSQDSSKPEDTVLEQSPAGGSEVDEGTSITIVISNGKGAKVPSVVGLTEGQAASALQKAGFSVVTSERTTDREDKDGIVYSQTPSAGRDARKGDSVTITVSRYQPEELPPIP